jgi:hypothetical protein
VGALAPVSHANAAVLWNRNWAIGYSNLWWNGRNPQYLPLDAYGGDCTNFVSQIMEAGGTAQNNDWEMYYLFGYWHWEASWSAVENSRNYHTTSHWDNGTIYASLWASSLANWHDSPGWPSDFITLHVEGVGGGYWNHYMHIVSTEWTASWNDYVTGQWVTYNTVVDKVNSHDNNRYHDPWNGAWRAYSQLNQYNWKYWNSEVVHINT